MSEPIKDGGPAFPQHEFVPSGGGAGNWHQAGGMSLRDYFAAQAIFAAWSSRNVGEYEGDTHDIAGCAYQLADAMLSAREAKQ